MGNVDRHDQDREVHVAMADGRALTIRGLEPPVAPEDIVEEQAEAVVPLVEQDLNLYFATRYAAGG